MSDSEEADIEYEQSRYTKYSNPVDYRRSRLNSNNNSCYSNCERYMQIIDTSLITLCFDVQNDESIERVNSTLGKFYGEITTFAIDGYIIKCSDYDMNEVANFDSYPTRKEVVVNFTIIVNRDGSQGGGNESMDIINYKLLQSPFNPYQIERNVIYLFAGNFRDSFTAKVKKHGLDWQLKYIHNEEITGLKYTNSDVYYSYSNFHVRPDNKLFILFSFEEYIKNLKPEELVDKINNVSNDKRLSNLADTHDYFNDKNKYQLAVKSIIYDELQLILLDINTLLDKINFYGAKVAINFENTFCDVNNELCIGVIYNFKVEFDTAAKMVVQKDGYSSYAYSKYGKDVNTIRYYKIIKELVKNTIYSYLIDNKDKGIVGNVQFTKSIRCKDVANSRDKIIEDRIETQMLYFIS